MVGGGLIGARHAAAVQAHGGCFLVGVVDPDPKLHRDPQVRYFADMADVEEAVDGAIIATPTHLHARHAVFAAGRGWAVLIEKPVASTLAEADAIVQAVEAANVASLVGHHRRYHPSVARLREVVRAGIGTPVTATLIWAMRKPDAYFDGNWRTAGGSPVMINLVHDVDLVRYVMGEIVDVAGMPGGAVRGADRLESGAVALRLEGGATVAISFADTAPSPWGFEAATAENPHIAATRQDMWWIAGTRGAVSYPSLTHWTGSDTWADAPMPVVLEAPVAVPLERQLDHFIEVISGAAKPLIDVADARKTLGAALRIEAALTGYDVPV